MKKAESANSVVNMSYFMDTPEPEKLQDEQLQEELLPYLPLLKMLKENQDKLSNLLKVPCDFGKIPRYLIPGTFICKTVHMVNTLDQMAREFSKEKNISQRDLFEVALIEFFQKLIINLLLMVYERRLRCQALDVDLVIFIK